MYASKIQVPLIMKTNATCLVSHIFFSLFIFISHLVIMRDFSGLRFGLKSLDHIPCKILTPFKHYDYKYKHKLCQT